MQENARSLVSANLQVFFEQLRICFDARVFDNGNPPQKSKIPKDAEDPDEEQHKTVVKTGLRSFYWTL